jgi:multidrug efflux pump subunit AcrA (membrane-fusion protein)
MRFLRQSLVGVFLAAMTLGLLAYAAQLIGGAVQDRMGKENRARPAQERVFAVNVIRAEIGAETPVLKTFGEVKSRRTLELRAAIAGRVIELSEQFVDGGAVMAGDVLVRIDPANAQSTVSRVQADIADAQADGRDATRALALAKDEQLAAQEQADLRAKAQQRQSDLLARGVGTAAAVEVAELAASSARQAVLSRRQAVTQAEARIDQATSALLRAEIAQADATRGLADTTLIAPFDGKLSAPSVVAGRLVGTNERLAELIDPDALEVSFRVSTAQYARLLDLSGDILGAEVNVILDVSGVDLTATGQINRASAGAGEGQTGRLIFAKLNDSVGFKTGDFVQVQVQEPAVENVVRLPSSALDASGTVLVLGSEDRLETIDVELIRRQGDDILVRGRGLEGRDVVEARSPLLGAGIVVKPLRGVNEIPAAPSMVELTDERRAKLVAFIEGNTRMPAAAKARVLAQLGEAQVPTSMVERIEGRMGG